GDENGTLASLRGHKREGKEVKLAKERLLQCLAPRGLRQVRLLREFLGPNPFAARPGDACGVEAEVGEQFFAFAMFDEVVGNAEAFEVRGVDAGGFGRFENRGAKATGESSFFHGDDQWR